MGQVGEGQGEDRGHSVWGTELERQTFSGHRAATYICTERRRWSQS